MVKARLLRMFFYLFYINTCESQVTTVEYLHGGPRIRSDSIFDYYFSCNTRGGSIEWLVNGDSIGGFLETPSGIVQVASHSNFNYISTLLFVNRIPQEPGVYQFVSVIIVTLMVPEILDIQCKSDLGAANTSNVIMQYNSSQLNNSGSVCLQPLFSTNIILDCGSTCTTYGFICGVQQNSLTWSIENMQETLVFSGDNKVGFVLPTYLSTDPITFNRLAFILASENEIIAVLFVTGYNGTSVTCSDGVNSKHLTVDVSSHTTTSSSHASLQARSEDPSEAPSSGPQMSETFVSSYMLTHPNGVNFSMLYTLVGVVSGVGLIIIVITTLVIVIIWRRKKMLKGKKHVEVNKQPVEMNSELGSEQKLHHWK